MISFLLKSEEKPGNNVTYTVEGPIGHMEEVSNVMVRYIQLDDEILDTNSNIKSIETKFILSE